MEKKKIPSFDECVSIVKYFYDSMHDYIFLYDIENDEYEISYKAYKKFKLPSNHLKMSKRIISYMFMMRIIPFYLMI